MDNSANRHNFVQNGPVIGLFAKEPVPGKVKTRLIPPLTAEQASQLYCTALLETYGRLCSTGLPVVICYAGQQGWFSATFPGVPLLAQSDGDLGARMEHAVQALFAAGAGPVLLAGSDCPDLPIPLLEQVVARLHDRDVALIPCHDGGYVVIGFGQPTTELFTGIPWSSPLVMAVTRQRCRDLGLTLHETTAWYDLDELADLRQLVVRSPESQTACHILATFRELF